MAFDTGENIPSSKWGDELTFKAILMKHTQKILDLQCCEWHGGYISEKPVQSVSGLIVAREYIEDTRERWINAVTGLYDALYSYLDEEALELTKEFDEELGENDKLTDKEGEDTVKNARVRLHRKLLRVLNDFLMRNDYLNVASAQGEDKD